MEQSFSHPHPCPDCGTHFKSIRGLLDHMMVDHWWDPPIAYAYGKERFAKRAA